MKLKAFTTLFICLTFLSCAKNHTFKDLPTDFVNHHLVVLAYSNDGVKLTGLKGATPAGSSINLTLQDTTHRTTSDKEGRFSIVVDHGDKTHTTGLVEIKHGSNTSATRYSIKNLSHALGDAVVKPFACDREIDAIDFFADSAFILSSQAALIREFKIDDYWRINTTAKKSMLLNAEVSLGARSLTTVGDTIVVPFFNTHEVAVIARHNLTLSNKSRLHDSSDSLMLFPIHPPAQLDTPINADEHGESATISKTAARNAEVVAAINDDYFLVGFANYFQLAEPSLHRKSVVGPGIIGVMAKEHDRIKSKTSLVLPCKNPTQLTKVDDTTFLVLCSGAYIFNEGQLLSEGAGVAKISLTPDFSALSLSHFLELKNFAPAPMAVLDQTMVIPKAWSNEVLVVNQSSTSFTDSDIKTPRFHRALQFTFAKYWHDDIFFLGDNQGGLVAFSLKDGFFPFPFVEPIMFMNDADKKLAVSAHQLYFRHQAEKYDLTHTHKKGFDAWAQTAVHQLIPLDFMQVFGP